MCRISRRKKQNRDEDEDEDEDDSDEENNREREEDMGDGFMNWELGNDWEREEEIIQMLSNA